MTLDLVFFHVISLLQAYQQANLWEWLFSSLIHLFINLRILDSSKATSIVVVFGGWRLDSNTSFSSSACYYRSGSIFLTRSASAATYQALYTELQQSPTSSGTFSAAFSGGICRLGSNLPQPITTWSCNFRFQLNSVTFPQKVVCLRATAKL